MLKTEQISNWHSRRTPRSSFQVSLDFKNSLRLLLLWNRRRSLHKLTLIGQNITISVHLSRKGNGSEYPAFLDISLTTYQNQSFAYQYPSINSTEAYNDLQREDGFNGYGRVETFFPQKMLLIQSQESLERRRKDSEDSFGMVSMRGSGRWPVSRGSVRYDFEEVEQMGKEEYEFDIEFPV